MSVVENSTHSCNLEEELSYHEKQLNYYFDKYIEAENEATIMKRLYHKHRDTHSKLLRSQLERLYA